MATIMRGCAPMMTAIVLSYIGEPLPLAGLLGVLLLCGGVLTLTTDSLRSKGFQLKAQRLDMEKHPHELHLILGAERGVQYPCAECGTLCKAHDFQEMTWRHLNFFQHLCFLTASVPRVDCPEHGIHRAKVPWARAGSGFTTLFEQVVMSLAREMPVSTISRYVKVTDKRIWRIIHHYIVKAMEKIDLSSVFGVGLDETASKRGHSYVTIFIDMDK